LSIISSAGGVFLTPAFFVFLAPGSIGTLAIVAGTAPVPLAAIAEEDVHPHCFFYPQDNPAH